MKSCPRCATAAPDTSFKCAQCGALLVAPPASAAPVHAPVDGDAAGAPSVDEQFFAPVAVKTLAPPPPEPAKRSANSERKAPWALIGAVVIVCLIAGVAYKVHSQGSSKPKTPIILTPTDPQAGLPTGLDQVVRQQAESSRQTAFSAVAELWSQNGGQLDAHQLEQVNPSLHWLDATVSSTGPHEVSFSESQNTVTIAISASSKDVCAFGRLALGGIGQYVTMGNMSSCRAIDAPADGWSTLRGGAASDLPPEGY